MPTVVTVFIMPTESCRKAQPMPVLTTTGKPLESAIANFRGMAPQYCVVKEDMYIAGLIRDEERKKEEH